MLRSRGQVAVAVGLICVSQAALGSDAKEKTRDFQLTPFVGYRFGGDFSNATDNSTLRARGGASLGLVFNYVATGNSYYEATYSRQDSHIDGLTPFDLTIEYFHVGGMVEFGEPDTKGIPYFIATIGATHFTPRQAALSDATEFSAALGLGTRFPLSDRWALRVEGRVYATFLNSDSSIFCAINGSTNTCAIRIRGNAFIQAQGAAGLEWKF